MTKIPKAKASAATASRPRKRKLTAEQRYLKIQEAAYYRAEMDNFDKDPAEYWLAAEAEAGA